MPVELVTDETPLMPWYEIAKAYERMGILEVPGPKAHPMILSFFQHTSLKKHKLAFSDETSWCSAFACACVEQAGLKSPHSAAARDWLKWGIVLTEPREGCITVFDRYDPKNKNAAHVAFWTGIPRDKGYVDVLGGNQRNRVCHAPYLSREIIGYRWPAKGMIIKRPV